MSTDIQKQKKNLIFMIDTTGSMGHWISALTTILPYLCQGIALTQIFNKIGIVSYKDYDKSSMAQNAIYNFSGYADINDENSIKKLSNYAAGLKCSGGGGIPEAWKTAMFKIANIEHEGKVYILHLVDAPPHTDYMLDSEGLMEKKELKNLFDYVELEQFVLDKLPNLHYSCLTSHIHQFYCHLAQRTGGRVYKHIGNLHIEPDKIRHNIIQILNNWLDFDDKFQNSVIIDPKLIGTFKTENELSSITMTYDENPEQPDSSLSKIMLDAVRKVRFDSTFVEHLIKQFTIIITENPMTLTISPIIGKMWRELCKRRNDVRRDELITLLNKRKHNLNMENRTILDNWLTESYDSEYEIREDLYIFMSKNSVCGLIRYYPEMDKIILKETGAEISLVAQQIVQMVNIFNVKSTCIIHAIFSRMMIDVNFNKGIIVENVSTDGENGTDGTDPISENQLPPNSIPLNMPIQKIFELIMHIVCPGTKLTRRYAAMIAIYAVQHGGVMSELGKKFLDKVRGKWINWVVRPDGSPEIPECWSKKFLNFVLHPDSICFALTEDEIIRGKRLMKINWLLRFYRQLEVSVKLIDIENMEFNREEHKILCNTCNILRPQSLITSNGECGYCHWGLLRPNIEYVMVTCHGCRSLYSRDKRSIVEGKSKCYACRRDLISPKTKCNSCNFSYVNYHKPFDQNKCESCAQGLDKINIMYKDINIQTDRIFTRSTFDAVCESLGFRIDGKVDNSSALYSVESITNDIVANPLIEITDTYYGNQIENLPEIAQYLKKVMSGEDPIMPDCSICFGQFHTSQLVPSCGRKNCRYRICIDCCKSWYCTNIPGNIICQRACLCQFCARIPASGLLAKINPQMISINKWIQNNPLDMDTYYGWCIDCLKPKALYKIECAGSTTTPNLKNYKCLECHSPSPTLNTKNCPTCTVCTSKTAGCNHIRCTSCDTHWCWECGIGCDSSSDTYDHMWSKHGRIFEYDTPINIHDDIE